MNEAAAELKKNGNSTYLARIDISQNTKIAERFKIRNRDIPKIIFFR